MPRAGTRKITEEPHRSALLQCLAEGVPIVHACGVAGVGVTTYTRTMAEAEEEGAPEAIRAFRADVEKAIGDGIREALERIRKAGREGNWTADAWLLERRYPRDFARRTVTEVTGPEGKPAKFVLDLTGGAAEEDEA